MSTIGEDGKERTGRGFRVFGRAKLIGETTADHFGGEAEVVESSEAFNGARAWVFLGDRATPSARKSIKLDVAGAAALRDALAAFVDEARADQLTEPAEGESDDE